MGLKTYIDPIVSNVERYNEEELSILWTDQANVQKWNNLDSDEIREMVIDTFDVLNKAIEKSILADVGFNFLNGINNNLNKFNNQFEPLKTIAPAQLQNQHHNPLNQLIALNTTLRNSGLYGIIKLAPDLPTNEKLIQEQLQNLNDRKDEVDKYVKQIRTLMSPAVADRLSTAFNKRKSQIFWQKIGWLILLISSVALAFWFTSTVSEGISKLLEPDDANDKLENLEIGIIWIIRLLVLFPIYFVVFFSLKQYSKERRLEEVYAHKSAISETLPSYPELLTNKEIGDDITSDAAAVIFAPAESDGTRLKERKNYKVEDLKELLEVASKLTTPPST